MIFATAVGNALADDENLTVHGQAPPDQAVLSQVRGGAFFVPKDLKEKYDMLLARVRSLKADIAAGNVAGESALRQLKQLEPEIESLRKEMQAKKTLVSPVKLQHQTEELAFELGPARMLIVTADHLRVVGWDEPNVKCVLEKTLLAARDKPEIEEFKAMRLTHRLGQAPDLVGKTDDVVAAEEKKFRAEHADKAALESSLAARQQLINEMQSSYAPYRPFQGKDVDVVEIEGLSGQQGNRQITVDIRSPGGGATMGSNWRRHATLTVYVPRCQGVLLRGCLEGLSVEGLKAPLIATDDGSLDRDYDGAFQITKLEGPLALYNVPLDRLEHVKGDVKIMATIEFANTGTHYEDGKRTTIIPPPRECVIEDITGNFSAQFSRASLKVGSVSGVVDIKNETGDTNWLITDAPADRPNRLVSESGRIDIRIKSGVLVKLPVMALTTEGAVTTNAPQNILEDTDFTTGRASDGSRRNWRGVKSVRPGGAANPLEGFERPARVLRGDERSAGLDLISRSGTVALTVEP